MYSAYLLSFNCELKNLERWLRVHKIYEET